MSRRPDSSTVYNDMLFVLMLLFASLFMITFPFINPIAEDGKIDPVVELMIVLRWDDKSEKDMDLWVRGPTGNPVGFYNRDGSYLLLDRDDLGTRNDMILVNGIVETIQRNIETTTVTKLLDGEYVVNVHHFSTYTGGEEVSIEVLQMKPFAIIFYGRVTLFPRQEYTLVSFIIENGKIIDVRTDIQISLRSGTPPVGDRN